MVLRGWSLQALVMTSMLTVLETVYEKFLPTLQIRPFPGFGHPRDHNKSLFFIIKPWFSYFSSAFPLIQNAALPNRSLHFLTFKILPPANGASATHTITSLQPSFSAIQLLQTPLCNTKACASKCGQIWRGDHHTQLSQVRPQVRHCGNQSSRVVKEGTMSLRKGCNCALEFGYDA